MDVEQCGCVTKRHFMNFLRTQPQFQALLVEGHAPQLDFWRKRPQEDAVRWRRVSGIWEEFCGEEEHLEWKQFMEFFRRRGWALDYNTKENPRDRLAEMLADMHTRPSEQDSQTRHEFAQLRGSHLQGEQKRQLGRYCLDKPWTLEAAGLAISKPSSSTCSTRAPSSRSSSRHSTSAPRGARLEQSF